MGIVLLSMLTILNLFIIPLSFKTYRDVDIFTMVLLHYGRIRVPGTYNKKASSIWFLKCVTCT